MGNEGQPQGGQQQGNEGQPGNQGGGQQQPPPWGSEENFNPERAWKLIEDLRADKERLSKKSLTDEQRQKLESYERLEAASKTELERQTEEATRWQTEAERWRGATVAARIEALAAPDFADPSDAAHALDPKKYLDAGGQIDEKAIRSDLTQLLEAKPHYRRQSDGPRPPAPNPNQGRSGSGSSGADPAQEFASILQGSLGPR